MLGLRAIEAALGPTQLGTAKTHEGKAALNRVPLP